MASILNDLRTLKSFLENEVCSKARFKVPDDDFETEDYPFSLSHPKVFLLENPDFPAAPSITIKPLSIEEVKNEHVRRILVQLLVVTWNPGIHSKELFFRTGAMDFETKDMESRFVDSLDGWSESLSLVDLINTNLMDRIHISDELEIDGDEPLTIVPLRPETDSIDLQNYFVQAMEFTLKRHIHRPNRDINAFEKSGHFSYEDERRGL